MVDILALGAHPDDIEFGCGAILAKASSQGHSILMVDLTIGDKSSHGTPEIRAKEGQLAASFIGAKRIVLDFVDCEIMDTYEGRLKLVSLIRSHRPRLILAPMWKGEQNHPDHIACGQMARYAFRYARFPKILPDLNPHRTNGILHYLPHAGGEADLLIDVSDHVDRWKRMMQAHVSQMKTYPYADWALHNAANFGGMLANSNSKTPYAQGLVSGNPIVVDDLMTVAQSTREI